MFKLSSWVIFLCFLSINISIYSQTTSYKDIFNTRFDHDFENNTIGAYRHGEWSDDWNNPAWANEANGLGEIVEKDGNRFLKVEFPPGSFLLDNSGIQWLTTLDSTYNELYFSYRVKFSAGFSNTELQGKIPGLSGGESNAGGMHPDGTDGWSARYMFHGTYLRFYVYHPELYLHYGDTEPIPGEEYYGETVKFDNSVKIELGKWYIVTQRIVMNNIGMHDGILEGYINDKLVAQKTDIRFRDTEQLAIDKVFIASFFGGSGSAPETYENICFDDFYAYLYNEDLDVPRGNNPSPPDRELLLPQRFRIDSIWRTSLSCDVITGRKISLSWDDYYISDDYIIERRGINDSLFTTLATLQHGILEYTDNNVEPATYYEYRIRTCDLYTDPVEITTFDAIHPDSPANLTASAVYKRQVNIAWDDSSNNELGFRVERSSYNDSSFVLLGEVSSGNCFYSDANLLPETNYYYRVYSYNEDGNSAYSNVLQVRTLQLTPPVIPGQLSASNITKNSLILSWIDNSNNENGFNIVRTTTSGSGYVEIATVGANVTSYNDAGLSHDTHYYYRVRAFNEDGYSSYNDELEVKTLELRPPASPAQLSASGITKNSLTLSWTDNANNENGFNIKRSNTPGSGYETIATVGANITSYNDAGLSYDTHYYYQVRAYNDDGYSTYSDELEVKTLELMPPAAPIQLTGSSVTKNSVILTWQDNSENEDGFFIVYTTTSDSGYIHVASTGADVGTYTVTGLTPDTDYYLRIRAFNDDGNSAYTPEIYIKTLQLEPPVAPGLLSSSNVTDNSLDLVWIDNSDNEDGFTIFRSTSFESGYIQAGTSGADVNTFHDTGLLPETYYYYRLQAYNDDGISGFSNTIKAQTLKKSPAVPGNLAVSNITKTSADLTWADNSDNEDGFTVMRSFYPDSGYLQVATTGANANIFHDDDLSPGTIYYYRVNAYNENGPSGYSEALMIMTLEPQPPAAPDQLSAHNVHKNSVDLLWTDNSDNEDGFHIIRSNSYDSGYVTVATLGANITLFNHKGLDKNSLYFFKVEAFNSDGNSGYSNVIKVLTRETELPLTPSALSASNITKSSVQLAWIDNSNNENGFELIRSTLLNSGYIQVASVPAEDNMFEDTGLLPNTTYYYKLRAFNEDGYSGFANILQIQTPYVLLPNAPSSLKTDTVGFDYVTISWLDNANNESGFRIERANDTSDGYLTAIDISTPNLTLYNDTGLLPNTTYYYRLSAFNEDGYSDYTNKLECKTLSDIPPSPPSSLLASEISLSSITLHWQDNSNDETGFVVKRATGTNDYFEPLITIQADDTVYIDYSVMPNTTYYYLVNAVNYAGNSNSSNTAVASTFSVSESNRVWDGLVAYYNFNINSNNVINDYSDYKEPLDLIVEDLEKIVWKTNNSIEIISNTVIKSTKPATKIVNACKETNAISLECWIKPSSINPSIESSIISISNNDADIGANLFQSGIVDMNSSLFSYAVNLKTKATARDGSPSLWTENEFSFVSLQHLVYVKDTNGLEKIYIDGEEVASSIRPKELDSWKDDYSLVLGNNLSMSNPWYGTYYMVAVYNTALSGEKILINYNAGPSDKVTSDYIDYYIEILPNPSEGLFNVKIRPQSESELISKTMIQICDLMGNVLSSDIFVDPCRELEKQFNLTGYPKGVYILRIISNDHSNCWRFIIK